VFAFVIEAHQSIERFPRKMFKRSNSKSPEHIEYNGTVIDADLIDYFPPKPIAPTQIAN
jgi:hypothetical protein